MNIEDTRTVLFSDKKRMEVFTSQLHQLRIDQLCERLQTTGWMSEADLDMLEKYFSFIGNNTIFAFNDKQIQTAFKKFNKIAETLDHYITDHFSYYRPQLRKGKAPTPDFEIYELYPYHKRSDDNEKRDLYSKRLKELVALTVSFGYAYYDLVRTGMQRLNKNKISTPQTNTNRIVGLTFETESGHSIGLTPKEKMLLEALLSQPRKCKSGACEYGAVDKKQLIKLFRTKKSYEEVRRRLFKKNPARGPKVFNIIKGYKETKRKRLSGFSLITYPPERPQGLRNIEES